MEMRIFRIVACDILKTFQDFDDNDITSAFVSSYIEAELGNYSSYRNIKLDLLPREY